MPAWLASTQIKSAARGFRPPSLTRHNLLDGFGRHSGCCCDCLWLLRLLATEQSARSRAQLRHNRRQIPQRWRRRRRWHWQCAAVVIAVRLFASPPICLLLLLLPLCLARPSLGLTNSAHTLQLDICLSTVNTHKANRKSTHTADWRVGDSFDWFMAASECSSKWERQHSNGIRWQFRDINLTNRLTGVVWPWSWTCSVVSAVPVWLLQHRHIYPPFPSDMQHCDEISFGFCGPPTKCVFNLIFYKISTSFGETKS